LNFIRSKVAQHISECCTFSKQGYIDFEPNHIFLRKVSGKDGKWEIKMEMFHQIVKELEELGYQDVHFVRHNPSYSSGNIYSNQMKNLDHVALYFDWHNGNSQS